jgi:hypothetical protein
VRKLKAGIRPLVKARGLTELKVADLIKGRFPTETSALMMAFGVLGDRLQWQKVGTRADDIACIEDASKSPGAGAYQPGVLELGLVSLES